MSVILLAGAIFGLEIVFMLAKSGIIGGTRGGEDWRVFALQRFVFSGEVWDWMRETGRWPQEHLMRLVTYPFVHYSFTHMVFVAVFVLALGKMVGEAFSDSAVLIIFFGSSIVGAIVFAELTNDPRGLAGGFPGAYGLIGAYTFVLWLGYRSVGANQFQAFRLIGLLLGIQLLFGLVFDTSQDWIAEIAGFATGFALSPLVAPGGLRHMLARLRDR
ncbi:MAG: rhomboid family intramembrane serine protease [Pseudomonadota bacterium]